LLSGKSDLAMLQATSVLSADVAVVAPLYYEAVHLLVRKGVEGHSLKELKGKRLAIGSSQSGSRQASRKILEYFGLSESDFKMKDIDWFALGSSEEVDAAIVVMKSGQPAIAELLIKQQFRLEPIEQSMEISLEEPSFHPIEILPADYPAALDKPLSTVATTAFLAARRDASSRLIRESLQALYDTESPIPAILSAERAAKWQGLAWHPAAQVYFEELAQRSQRSKQ
jgi:TRAP transporter TAXI family solute receptor